MEIIKFNKIVNSSESVFVIATVIAASGSTYRGVGARMLINDQLETFGEISGGCLENDIVQHSKEVFEKKYPKQVFYETGTEKDVLMGTGLGCKGTLTVLLEYLNEQDKRNISWLESQLMLGHKCFLALKTDGRKVEKIFLSHTYKIYSSTCEEFEAELICKHVKDFSEVGQSQIEEIVLEDHQNSKWLIETVLPPTRIVLFGAGDDTVPLCSMASALGWHVSLVDHRKSLAVSSRFPTVDNILVGDEASILQELHLDKSVFVLVMTHLYLKDKELIKKLLPLELKYLGLLGPAKKAARLLSELEQEGMTVTKDWLEKFHSPIGLDIGSETSAEVALSIVAEIQTVISGKAGNSLKNRILPIHNREIKRSNISSAKLQESNK